MRGETVISAVVYCTLIKNGYCGNYVQNTRYWKLLEGEKREITYVRAKDARVKERLSAYGTSESFKVARKFNHERTKQPPCHWLWPSVSALHRDSILARHPNVYIHVTWQAAQMIPLKSLPKSCAFFMRATTLRRSRFTTFLILPRIMYRQMWESEGWDHIVSYLTPMLSKVW